MEYVKVNGVEYPASITGVNEDYSWDKRESKTITFEKGAMDYNKVVDTFPEGVEWSIVSEWTEELFDEEGKPFEPPKYIEHRDEYDNSEYSMTGDITDHRDGKMSIKMGKLTEVESLIEDIYGEELF